jgi:hypothetical protein
MLALLPLKDWVYLGVILALLAAFGGYTIHERRAGAAHEITALQKSSAKLTADADKKIATLTAAHAATVEQVVKENDAKIAAANTEHSSDLERLREYDAYRRQHPTVSSASQPAGTTSPGSSGTVADSDIVSRLGGVGAELAEALRVSDAALSACMVERSSIQSHLP